MSTDFIGDVTGDLLVVSRSNYRLQSPLIGGGTVQVPRNMSLYLCIFVSLFVFVCFRYLFLYLLFWFALFFVSFVFVLFMCCPSSTKHVSFFTLISWRGYEWGVAGKEWAGGPGGGRLENPTKFKREPKTTWDNVSSNDNGDAFLQYAAPGGEQAHC